MAVKRILVFLFILLVISAFGWPQPLEMKSVTVAGFINKGKSNQDNINAIMTKSLSTFLSKISKNITPYNEVEKTALEDNFWNKKELNSDEAIHIAQRFSTEQVITGDYIVNDKNDTISIKVFVYNVINGQLLFQRNYKGSAGPEIFDTIDKMILDVSGLLVGKPIKLGYARVAIKQEGVSYKLFVNDGFIKLINSKEGYIDKFVSGQSVDITLKSDQSDKEVLKKKLEIQSGKTNQIDYNPSGSLILVTIEGGNEVNMNGASIGKTDNSGELKIPDILAGKYLISVKNRNGLISDTNIVVNEGDIKVVVFKSGLQNNTQSGAGAENLPWIQRPWYQRFTLGLSFGYKFLDKNALKDFYSKAGPSITASIPSDSANTYITMDADLLFRAFNYAAIGVFAGFPLTGGSKGLVFETATAGAILRIIPLSFPAGDTESMLYIDFKAGVGGGIAGPIVQSGFYDQSGKQIYSFWLDDKPLYFAVALGGLWGLGPVQLGVSAAYEYCKIGNIKYRGNINDNSDHVFIDSSGNNIVFDVSGFVLKTDINLNF